MTHGKRERDGCHGVAGAGGPGGRTTGGGSSGGGPSGGGPPGGGVSCAAATAAMTNIKAIAIEMTAANRFIVNPFSFRCDAPKKIGAAHVAGYDSTPVATFTERRADKLKIGPPRPSENSIFCT
jgi:hypothetical protein